VDEYVEAQKRLPSREIQLETIDGTFYFFKADILKNEITYSTDKNFAANLVAISGRRAFEIINMNRKGEKPERLSLEEVDKKTDTESGILNQDSLTRFDKKNPEQPKRSNNKRRKRITPNNGKTGTSNNSEKNDTNKKEQRIVVLFYFCKFFILYNHSTSLRMFTPKSALASVVTLFESTFILLRNLPSNQKVSP
jgi:hypothetical protein